MNSSIATKEDMAVFETHAYLKWKSLMNRVEHSKDYIDVKVDERWLDFSSFETWLLDQDYEEGWHLDKDLLSIETIIYGPDTCIMIPHEVNTAIKRPKVKGDGLPGRVWEVYINNSVKYKATHSNDILGYFDNIEAASKEALKYKAFDIIEISKNYDGPIKDALVIYADNLASGKIPYRNYGAISMGSFENMDEGYKAARIDFVNRYNNNFDLWESSK